jgi:hypothetical protein
MAWARFAIIFDQFEQGRQKDHVWSDRTPDAIRVEKLLRLFVILKWIIRCDLTTGIRPTL